MAELTIPIALDSRHAEVLEEARVLARSVEPMAIEADESSQIYRPSPPARLRFLARSPNGRSLAFADGGALPV